MIDPVNPTAAEIRHWAYNGYDYPCEDWDIIVFSNVLSEERAFMVLEIAADNSCPNKDKFLHFLSVMTGSAVRAKLLKSPVQDGLTLLSSLIQAGHQSPDVEVRAWARKAEGLFLKPSSFEYEEWFH